MNEYLLLVKEMFNHTIKECIQNLKQYELIIYEDVVKKRLIQQIYTEKLKQLDYFYELYKEIFDEENELKDNEDNINCNERQSIADCLIEEVEYLNEIQAISNNIDNSYERLISNIMLIQHEIIYKLIIIEKLK